MEMKNPYSPGAAHAPPHLAGRHKEKRDFDNLLNQDRILENVILTGLRGIGKTVLLREEFKPSAIKHGWLWVGNDWSEEAAISEENCAKRLLTDLAVVSSDWIIGKREIASIGFDSPPRVEEFSLDYDALNNIYKNTSGLSSDKLKATLGAVWRAMKKNTNSCRGIVFAYDEAQNLADRKKQNTYPLSMLLDVFSSLQSQGAPFLLVLSGLPTLFPQLVETRTYTERMFHVITLSNLNREETSDSILKPLTKSGWYEFFKNSSSVIFDMSQGYPYFVQYWCRELFDYIYGKYDRQPENSNIIDSIRHKLDKDFFEGRWNQLTDRERDLLGIIAKLQVENEFSVQDIVQESTQGERPFKSSHVNQMLARLANKGMAYKNRHGKYVLAVPMLGEFILRNYLSNDKKN